MSRFHTIIVPDWHGAGPGHWQSLWAAELPGAQRLELPDWEAAPQREIWVAALQAQVMASTAPVLVVAHGLGCIATAHLPAAAAARIHGALLVAPADPERRAQLSWFAPVPYAALPYRSVLVASSNDAACPIRLTGAYARAWSSEFVRMQNAGHIDLDAGFGPWPLGQALFQSLTHEAAQLAAPRSISPQAEPLAHP